MELFLLFCYGPVIAHKHMQALQETSDSDRARNSIINNIGETAFTLISGRDGQRPMTGVLGVLEAVKGFCIHRSKIFFGVLAILIIITIILWVISKDVCPNTTTSALMPWGRWGSVGMALIWGIAVPIWVGWYNYKRAETYTSEAEDQPNAYTPIGAPPLYGQQVNYAQPPFYADQTGAPPYGQPFYADQTGVPMIYPDYGYGQEGDSVQPLVYPPTPAYIAKQEEQTAQYASTIRV